jgi:hypothetical protein
MGDGCNCMVSCPMPGFVINRVETVDSASRELDD